MKPLHFILPLTIILSGCRSTETASTETASGSAFGGMARIEFFDSLKIESIDGEAFKPGLGKSEFHLAPGAYEALVHLSSMDIGPDNVTYNLEGKPVYFKFTVEADKNYELRCLKQRSRKIYTPYFVETNKQRTVLLTPMDDPTKQLVFEALKRESRKKEIIDGAAGQSFDPSKISQPYTEH